MQNILDGLFRLIAPNVSGDERTTLYSRRGFLARMGKLTVAATTLPALLAACGGMGKTGQAAGTTAAPTPTAMPDNMAAMTPAAPQASPAAAVATNEVTIENFSFQPATITVPVGTEVIWTNHDDVPHTVTSRDQGRFSSDALDTDNQFKFRFDTAGTFAYYCAIHPIMNGQVIVQ